MKYILHIQRQKRGETNSYRQSFLYEPKAEGDTVATALTEINKRELLTDAEGISAEPVEWECSCLQKKCGACAMVINGRPQLACGARLIDCKRQEIMIEPLKKFPVVCDLVVDRSILFENLKTLRLWLNKEEELPDRYRELAYEASECIQCGCCLEVCPNFYTEGKFFGMSVVPVTARLLTEIPVKEAKEIAKLYARHTFEGCGKSLACQEICPKGIDTEKLLVNANAMAVWKRRKQK